MDSEKQKKLHILKSLNRAERGAEAALLFLTFVYPLIFVDADFGALKLQPLLLLGVTLIWLLWNFLLIGKGEWKFPKPRYTQDLIIGVLVVFELLQILMKILGEKGAGEIRFDIEVTAFALSFLYFLMSSGVNYYQKYADAVLFSGLIMEGQLLLYYLSGMNMDRIMPRMLNNSGAIPSHMLLLGTLGLLRYIRCKDKMKSFFYVCVSALSYFILFISESRVGIWLMVLVFFAVPVMFRPTAELVKRDMQLCFLYLFMLSNMSLLGNYTHIIQKEIHYDLEHSVYLELFLAIGGALFFHFWDRIPNGINPERLLLRKMRRGYQFLLKTLMLLLLIIIVAGEKWTGLPKGMGTVVWNGFAIPLVQEIQQSEGTFYFIIKEQGLIAFEILILFCSLLIARLRKNFGFDKPQTGGFILLTFLFLVQLLFWKPEINTVTIYTLFMGLAVFYKEEKVKVSVKGICLTEGKKKI